MKYFLIAAGLSAFLTSVALAADSPSGEALVVPAYPADGPWKKTVLKDDAAMRWEESIPEKEPENDVRNVLTAQTLYAFKGQKPAAFVAAMFVRLQSTCDGLRVDGPKEDTENGYPTAYGMVHCDNQKSASKTVDFVVKAVGGKDALYLVQREFRFPLTPPDPDPPDKSHFPAHHMVEMMGKIKTAFALKYLTSEVRLCPDAACVAKAAP